LVYDYNQNKIVNSYKEIVLTSWDADATSDFDALKRKFDSNRDGVFDEKDQAFNKFYLWQDLDQDGASQDGELTSLIAKGIRSISFNFEAPEGVLEKEFGVLNIAKVTWENGKTTYAYDVAFTHSTIGIRLGLVDEGVVLSYKNKDSYKIYNPANSGHAVNLSLESNDYDLILGSIYSDAIKLRGEHSVIVDAGEGDDDISTGTGNDWVKGGRGNDTIQTGAGHNILFIDAQDKDINAGEGFDVAFVISSEGVEIDLAATGIEAIYCNIGEDKIIAKGLNGVQIHANAGDDTIVGSDGDDIIVGGLGKDAIVGGDGNDKIFVDYEDDFSKIDAGEGEDSIYVTGNIGVVINMGSINAENFFGSTGNDKATA
jgi:Ca2+-binding RTX toxin-like protein